MHQRGFNETLLSLIAGGVVLAMDRGRSGSKAACKGAMNTVIVHTANGSSNKDMDPPLVGCRFPGKRK